MDACPDLGEWSDAEFLREFGRKAEEQGIPLAASIELTERCNYRCVHCYLGDQDALRKQKAEELDTGQWLDILDQITDLGSLSLLITGGDPLLRRDFAEIYSHARHLGLVVSVFTNGSLVDDTIVDLFRDLPPRGVEITVYGATAETYEAVTGVAGSYERCMRGIDLLREAGVELGLRTILMEPNKHELHQIGDLARTLGTREFRFDIEIQGGFGQDPAPLAVRLEPEEAVRLEQSCPEVAEAWKDYYRRRLSQEAPVTQQIYNCGAGRSGIHVNPYGRLQPCLAVRHLGYDLLEGTVRDGLVDIRRQLSDKKAVAHECNVCEDRMVCSACPAFALQEIGTEERPADFQCKVTKLRRELIGPVEER